MRAMGVGDGHLYLIWNSQFTCCGPGTDYTRSTDGGQTYPGPYSTPNPRLFLCSAATPPGGGVHGQCGYWAAQSALKRLARG